MFRKQSVQQLVAAVKDKAAVGWEGDFAKVLRSHCRVACPTQIIEDSFGTAKNAKIVRAARRYRRPEVAMSSILRHNVLDERHKWTTVSADTLVGAKSERLQKEDFQAKVDARSLPWQSVVSTSSAAGWYSPKAENFCANVADLRMLESAMQSGNMNIVSEAWVGDIAAAAHKLIVGVAMEGGDRRWFHVLHHVDKSSVIAWPGRLEKLKGSSHTCFYHDESVNEFTFLPLTTFNNLMACTFVWRSWASLVNEKPQPRTTLPRRLHLVVNLGPSPVLEVAARCAF